MGSDSLEEPASSYSNYGMARKLGGSMDIAVDMATDQKFNWRDAAIYIYSSADGVLDIVSDTTIAMSGAITTDSSITMTCTDLSAPLVMTNTVTTAAKTGGRALFQLNANAALGGWSNALKGIAVYSTAGSTSGMGSAVCGEIVLSTSTTTGTYAPLETELVANSAVSTGTATSFLYGNIDGSNATGKTTLNTNGYLFELGAGVVTTTDGMFEEVTVTAAAVFDAVLRVRVAGVNYFIGLCDDKAFT